MLKRFFTCFLLIAAVVLLFGIFSQFQPPVTNSTPNGVTVINYSTFVEQVKAGNLSCDVGSLLNKPGNGPHTWSYLEIQFEATDHTNILTFLQFHHKNNSVLIHPISVYHGLNHTTRALWLGDKQPVKTDFLADFDRSVVEEINRVKDDRKALVQLMYTHMVPSRYGISPQEVYDS